MYFIIFIDENYCGFVSLDNNVTEVNKDAELNLVCSYGTITGL
jgi:hypothetical protein